MLRWSVNLFRVRGIMLAVHFSFFLLLAVQAFIGWSDGELLGAVEYAGVLLACFICVVLHELGHCFTAMHFGIGVRRILLLPIGGMAEFDDIPRQPSRELLITVAGPAVNFVIAGLLWLVVPAASGIETSDASTAYVAMTAADFGYILMSWNLMMGCFNLLPAFPMDGGRILRSLLALRLNYLRATFWAASVGKVVCLLAIGFILFGNVVPRANAGLMAGLFGFIFLVGEMEFRATRRREIEDAHLRDTLERLSHPLLAHPEASNVAPVTDLPVPEATGMPRL